VPDAGVDDSVVVSFGERLKKNWWRLAVVAATLLMAVFAWYEPIVAVFTVVPVLAWCWSLGRLDRRGVVTLAVAAWILLPRGLGFSGPWVPSVFEVCLLLPIIAAFVHLTGLRSRRWPSAIGFTAFFVAGFVVAVYTAAMYSDGATGDEGVWPGPSGLQIVEVDGEGGSSFSSRRLEATGDRAPERMRDYLASRGFTDQGHGCRANGVVLTYKVCAAVVELSPTKARVSWWI
jgi:hypothetical protein